MTLREFSLLLLCSQSRPDLGAISNLVSEGLNWQTLLRLAEEHGVRPMLVRALRAACWAAVPQPIKLELESFYRANLQKSLFFTGELFRLLGSFRQNDIAAAAFKGPILA